MEDGSPEKVRSMKISELTQEEVDEKIQPLISCAFGETFSYSVFDIRTQKELAEFPRLKESFRKREFIYLGAFSDSGELLGYSLSYQSRVYEIYTQTSVVLPAFRRQGVYTELTKTVLKLAEERGYQMVVSSHVPSNNSVIVAKLKLGFRISGFELSDDFGSLVKLTYYLNDKRSKMFDVRSGFLRPDAEQKTLLKL